MSIHNKEEIIYSLNEKVDAFNHFIFSLNKEEFEAAPQGKWTAGQNLDHLIRAINPLQLAFVLPKIFLIEILFFTICHNEHHLQLLIQRETFKPAHQFS